MSDSLWDAFNDLAVLATFIRDAEGEGEMLMTDPVRGIIKNPVIEHMKECIEIIEREW